MPEQRWLRIILVAFVMYTISFIDRTNISLALPSISRDLHLDPMQAGEASGIFFWGYMVLQIPGGYLASRWSAKWFVSILLVVWGLCAVLCGLVRTWQELWVMRLLLGIAEGGVWPATLVLLSNWFPRSERARSNAYWMLCLPLSVALSSPVSGWILGRWNWRVLLISEGALPFLWLVMWIVHIDDHPSQARWISTEEREYLERTLSRERGELEPAQPEPMLAPLLRPQVLIMVCIYFLLTNGVYGYLFWLPSLLGATAQHLSSLQVGLLNAIPYFLTAVGMVLLSRHSDKVHERRKHVAFGMAWGGVFLLASVVTFNHEVALSFALLALVGAGTYGVFGPFWTIPTETLPRGVAGPAMGLINAVGNLGGYFGPLVVGYLNKRTGNFVFAFGVLSLGLMAGSGLSFLLHPSKIAPAAQTANLEE